MSIQIHLDQIVRDTQTPEDAAQLLAVLRERFQSKFTCNIAPVAHTPAPVLSVSELSALEALHTDAKLTARDVWWALRQEKLSDHYTGIRLGRQLAARYPATRRGPTSVYTIRALSAPTDR